MPDWTLGALLLAALCGAGVLGLSQAPAGCRDSSEYQVAMRAIGEVWTKPGCLQGVCRAGPHGDGVTAWYACDPQPFPDCESIPAPSRSAEYPGCCAQYRCPGRCFSSYQQRWFAVGDEWTEEGCIRAFCDDRGDVVLMECGLIDISEPGCRAVRGNSSAEYPDCCYRAECEKPVLERPCYDRELERHFAVGESWTLPGCGGRATCGPDGRVSAVGCPLETSDFPDCSLDNGDTSLEFPQCCPKVTCKACYSQRNNRYFGPGDTWTGEHCTKRWCIAGPDRADVLLQQCGFLGGQSPYPDCEPVDEDLERDDYPRCCAHYRCPGRCDGPSRWFSVGEQWDDGCTRALCIGTDRVERLMCPLLRVDPSRSDCRLVEGNTNASYPACCPTVQCDTPLTECRDAEAGSREVGAVWTEPGCVRSQCVAAEGGVAVVSRSSCPPRPSPDCALVEEYSEAEYPNCCPTYRCPGRCFSPVKGRWFAVGDEWTEDGCTRSVCVSTAQMKQEPCPFVKARRPGCSVVPGDPIADYPGCCRHVECEPNPYG